VQSPKASRHDHPPIDDTGIVEIGDSDRLGVFNSSALAEARKIVVPSQDEREDAGRDDARQCERQDDIDDRLQAAASINAASSISVGCSEKGAQQP
jgi:hypothetical protein